MMSITDSSRAPTPQRGPSTTPLPTFTRRLDFVLMDEDHFRNYADSVAAEPVVPSRPGPPGGWGGLIASGIGGAIAGLLHRRRP